ncbi:phosphatidylinositol-glycan biosynthesis class S protein-domain-containing protein [Cytidiella melzeri]|nr:phosphatidylinositol-glycan biosynthesis class S protein-domain-containing protein [Cytidiella melzeri]
METQQPPVDPSRLSFESVVTRRRIIASYWVVVLLAIPLWWRMTSIDRLSLPESRVSALNAQYLRFPLRVSVHSGLPSLSSLLMETQLSERLLQNADRHRLFLDNSSTKAEPLHTPGIYEVVIEAGEPSMFLDGRRLVIRTQAEAGLKQETVLDTLSDLILPSSESMESLRVVKYSPRYRLAFSLLNEDASSNHAILSWDVKDAIERYLAPTLQKLSILHNFTIESQVQYHAPLAFRPKAYNLEGLGVHGLTPEDLTVFVNSAEWTLSSSVSNDPVIHFVAFVPSANSSPLYILNSDGTPSSADAFILPQWGGITIVNQVVPHLQVSDLHHTFATFRRQLMSLVGVPPLPPNVDYDLSLPFTDWQLDALVRLRTRQNVDNSKETLKSIVALVNQIENMPVGQDVKGDVQGALNALDMVFAEGLSSLTSALSHSSDALARASRAFFNPGMLALLYFPAEHKYAVYTPLFASVAAPLVATLMREIAAWRRARKAKAQARAQVATAEKGGDRQKVD